LIPTFRVTSSEGFKGDWWVKMAKKWVFLTNKVLYLRNDKDRHIITIED